MGRDWFHTAGQSADSLPTYFRAVISERSNFWQQQLSYGISTPTLPLQLYQHNCLCNDAAKWTRQQTSKVVFFYLWSLSDSKNLIDRHSWEGGTVHGQESCKAVSLLKVSLHVIPASGISIGLYSKTTLAAPHVPSPGSFHLRLCWSSVNFRVLEGDCQRLERHLGLYFPQISGSWGPYTSKAAFFTCSNTTLRRHSRETVSQEPWFTLLLFILASANVEIISFYPLFCRVFAC